MMREFAILSPIALDAPAFRPDVFFYHTGKMLQPKNAPVCLSLK